MSLLDGFFEELRKLDGEAIVLHRNQDGLPALVTVPPDFSPSDVSNCLRSFGFEADLGDVYDAADGSGDYATVTLINVREYLPPVVTTPKLVVNKARATVKRGLELAVQLTQKLAKKL